VSAARTPPLLAAAQRAVPIGQRLLPRLAESPSRAALATALARWPGIWGMHPDSTRVRAARRAYAHAFPDADADAFLARWLAARGADLGGALVHAARRCAGRRSSLIAPDGALDLRAERGGCIVGLLHYSIDPAPALQILLANPVRSFLWPLYPLQPGIEDDRVLWLARARIPPAIQRALLPVTEASWTILARAHLDAGGALFVAIDTPFDRRRDHTGPVCRLRVGDSTLPLAASIDDLAGRTGAALLFASPWPRPQGTWHLRLQPMSDIHALASAASRWIDEHPLSWAGWPYLRWREPSVAMRRNVARLPASHTP
jgi:hypothetical protein